MTIMTYSSFFFFVSFSCRGGVLRGARAQEEILFAFRPEMFVGMAICPRMEDYESIIVRGAERYSTMKGYGRTLAYEGNYVDDTERDEDGALKTEIACFDATIGNNFTIYSAKRDLFKAYVAFVNDDQSLDGCVATGNWGCGAFGGE